MKEQKTSSNMDTVSYASNISVSGVTCVFVVHKTRVTGKMLSCISIMDLYLELSLKKLKSFKLFVCDLNDLMYLFLEMSLIECS